MLSAFHARKVRLAAVPGLQEPPTSPLTVASPDPHPPAPDNAPRHLSRKRKPEFVSENDVGQQQRRKKTDDRKPEAIARRFDVPANAPEPELQSLTDEEISLSDQELRSKSHVHQQRVWSPSEPILDSSDEEVEMEAEEGGIRTLDTSIAVHTTLPFSPEIDTNTFRLTPDECSALTSHEEPATVMILPVHFDIALVGVYQLMVLQGSVMVMGVTLVTASVSHAVFSPKLSPLPCIESLGNAGQTFPMITRLPDRLRVRISPDHAVVLIRAHTTGIEGLGRVMRTFESMFQPSQPASVDLGIPGVYVYNRGQGERNVNRFVLPTAWDQEASDILGVDSRLDRGDAAGFQPIVCQITGPKSSGKSTFAKMLSSRLTTRYAQVAVLDCDPGQSEFSPSGMVALTIISKPFFGPSFTHPTTSHAAHFIGSPTPRNSPTPYLDAIQALIQTYKQDIEFPTAPPTSDSRITEVVPLVINSMGWTKGLGADLNRRIEEMVEPSDIFQFENLNQNFNFGSFPPTPIPDNPGRRFRHLPPAQTFAGSSHTPAELRALSLMSYFHAVRLPAQNDHHGAQLWETETPLCAKVPYEVCTSVAFDRVVLATPGMEDVVLPEIQNVLNGSVVALVESHDETFGTPDRSLEAGEGLDALYKQGTPSPSPFSSNCLGLALVRSLSGTRMQLITPVPPELLGRCRILVKGEIELPIWGMLDFRAEDTDSIAGVEMSKVPYLRWGKIEGLGGNKRRVRRNLMRKGQL